MKSANPDGNDRAAHFIRSLRWEDIPPEVRRQAKVCLRDLVGACLAGAEAKGSAILMSVADRELGGPKEATIIGTDRKSSSTVASLVNGFSANALDIDDGYRPVKGHPGAAVFPTVLALSERIGAPGTDLLTSLVIGYEIAMRAGMILHRHYGFYHGTGSWGAVGAAAAGARLLRLSERQIRHALGIAESYAPLIPEMRAVANPAMAPKDGVPWGAMTGTLSTLLAREGYTGIPSLLGDPAHNDDVFTLGRRWRIMDLYFKPYPCCRWAQPAIDGVLSVMRRERLSARDISRVEIRTFSEAIALYQDPPATLEEAEYHVRYPVAAAILTGDFTPECLREDRFQDGQIRQIMERIRLVQDGGMQQAFPERCLSSVEIARVDGRVFASGTIAARGDADHPLSEEDHRGKFRSVTTGILSAEETETVLEMIGSFERYDTEALIRYLGKMP